MAEFMLFHCNYVGDDGHRCPQPLDEGWITACSHVFCGCHAKAWFRSHDNCPVCRNGPVKLVRMESSAAVRRRGRTALLGLTPPEVVRATEVAINFWLDQKLFELSSEGRHQAEQQERHRNLEEAVRSRLGDAQEAARRLETEQLGLKRRLQEASSEGQRLQAELARLQAEVTDAEEEQSREAERPSRECRESREPSLPPLRKPRLQAGANPGLAERPGSVASYRPERTATSNEDLLRGPKLTPLFAGRVPNFLLSGARPGNRRRIT